MTRLRGILELSFLPTFLFSNKDKNSFWRVSRLRCAANCVPTASAACVAAVILIRLDNVRLYLSELCVSQCGFEAKICQ